jgi:hypothetical protein
MAKHTYTVWVEYGFDVQSDELLDPDNDIDYIKIQAIADNRLREIGLDDMISEVTYSNITVEESE